MRIADLERSGGPSMIAKQTPSFACQIRGHTTTFFGTTNSRRLTSTLGQSFD
jgi:hypothetical protein